MKNDKPDLLQQFKKYMENIHSQADLDQLERLFKDEKLKKIVKQSIILERVAVPVIVSNYLDQKNWI